MLSNDAKEFVSMMHNFRKLGCRHQKEMTQTEFITMMIVYKSTEEKKTVKVSDLAKKLKNTMPAMSRILKQLEQKNYVERVADKNDRRSVIVKLTDSGEEVIIRQIEIMDQFTNRVIERVGSEDLAILLQLLTKLHGIMEEEMDRDGI